VIRFHRILERGFRHPVIGLLLLVLLAILVVFADLHELDDVLPGDFAFACVAIVLDLFTIVPLALSWSAATRLEATLGRARPVERGKVRAPRIQTPSFVPLRL
jgi:hypothetical protein